MMTSDTTQPTERPVYQYKVHVTDYTLNVINQKLFDDPAYIAFRKDNLDIFGKIKNILKTEFGGYTIEYICEQLDMNPIYINQMLSIWVQHYCSFFAKYGRVIFNPINTHWIFIPNRHPQSRQTDITFDELKFYHMR